jgi:hypothetical protein
VPGLIDYSHSNWGGVDGIGKRWAPQPLAVSTHRLGSRHMGRAHSRSGKRRVRPDLWSPGLLKVRLHCWLPVSELAVMSLTDSAIDTNVLCCDISKCKFYDVLAGREFVLESEILKLIQRSVSDRHPQRPYLRLIVTLSFPYLS